MEKTAKQTQIQARLVENKADLIERYGKGLQKNMLTNRSQLRPAALKRLATAEADSLLAYFSSPTLTEAQQRGIELCELGLSEDSLLQLGQAARQFCLTVCTPKSQALALETIDVYYAGLMKGFIKADHARILAEQEQIRQALNETLNQYALQMKTAADIAAATTSLLDLNTLLQTAVSRIQQQLDYYFAGIFLLDDYREWALLRAATGKTGQNLVNQGFKLPLDENTNTGWTILNQRVRVSASSGNDPYHPVDLSEATAWTEITVPLKVQDKVIGALFLQSYRALSFSEQDTDVLRLIADQIAQAIENARLFMEAQTNLRESQILQQQYLLDAWQTAHERQTGYLYEHNTDTFTPIEDLWRPEMEQASRLKEPVIVSQNPTPPAQTTMAVPITLRDEVIGVIELYDVTEAKDWGESDVAMAQDVITQTALSLENARLFNQTQEALDETAVLYGASAALNAVQSYQEVLDVLRQHTIVGKNAQNVSLNFFDKPWTATQMPIWTDVLARYTELGEGAVQQRYRLAAFPAAATLLNPNTPTVIADVVSSPELDENARHLYAHIFKAASTIFVPLVVGGSWIGYINAIYQQPTQFPEDEVRRLLALSGQAAVAIQNVYAAAETQARAQELQVLNEMSQALASMLEPNEIIKSIYTYAKRLVETSNFYVALHDTQKNIISFPIAIEDEQQVIWAERPFGHGMTEYLIKGKNTVLIEEDVDGWQKKHGVASIGSGAQSWLGVPMITGNQAIGVIAAQSSESHVFNQNHMNLLSSIASQVTIAIQNARLFQQTRERARREQILRQITANVRNSADVDTIMRTAVQEVGRTLGRRTMIRLGDDSGA